MYLFELYHAASKKQFEPETLVPYDAWPVSWKTVNIKTYERFPTCVLPIPRASDVSVADAIRARHSVRTYACTMDEQDLSDILFYSAGEKPSSSLDAKTRVYASAGSRYPLEVYVCIWKRVGALSPGVYHYSVEEHMLRRLDTFNQENVGSIFHYNEVEGASCAIVITAMFERSTRKYGELGYRHMLLEAGEITAHVHIVATALGVGSVSMSGFTDEKLEEVLDIDGVTESVLHTVVCG